MSGTLEPRGPGAVPERPIDRPPTTPTGPTQNRPEPGRRLLYDQVGPTFDGLDANIRRALRQAGLCQERPLIEVVDPPRVLRRAGEVRHEQVATWASESQLVVITCTRPLAQAGPGRYRPTGAWEGVADVAYLCDAVRTEHGWGGVQGGGGSPVDWPVELPVASGPTELLHPGLAAQLSATAQSWARALDSPRRFTETLSFVDDLGPTVRLIRAQRAAPEQATVALAPWGATMVVAAVGHRERIRLVTRSAARLLWPLRNSTGGSPPEVPLEPRPQLTKGGDAGASSDPAGSGEDRPARGWIARQIERGRP